VKNHLDYRNITIDPERLSQLLVDATILNEVSCMNDLNEINEDACAK
jgi:hypothetical protein